MKRMASRAPELAPQAESEAVNSEAVFPAESPTQNGVNNIHLLHVAPAKAGVQGNLRSLATLDSRFRGNDE
jgi:hypothetical protein